MNNKTKKIIAGIGVTAIIGTGVLVTPINPTLITANNWRNLSVMYNYEIKQMGGVNLANIKKEDIITELNKKIRARKVLKPVIVNKKVLSIVKYESLRENLMRSVEKTDLLNKILR